MPLGRWHSLTGITDSDRCNRFWYDIEILSHKIFFIMIVDFVVILPSMILYVMIPLAMTVARIARTVRTVEISSCHLLGCRWL